MRVRTIPDRPRDSWATYVSALRQATGISRAEMARRLGVDPTTVWRWETGRQKPESPAVPQAMAGLFHLDLDEALAAAGLKPDVEPPKEPTRERDEEMELILSAPVDERTKKQMIDRLLMLREQDRRRRIDEIEFWIRRGRESA